MTREKRIAGKYRKITLRLIGKKLTITTMESATAGEIASLLTDTEGASAVLKGAFVTYSNEGKIMQGVPEETIREYGVYSKETACAMAEACRRAYRADFGIGVTGTFGNVDPANADSIPGQIYYAIAMEEGIHSCSVKLPQEESRRDYKLAVAELVADELLALL